MSDWEEDCDMNPGQNWSGNNGRKNLPPNNYGERRYYNGNRAQRGRGNGSWGNDYKESVDIRSDCFGLIIGKGGANIQRLESDYNVRINLDKGSGTATVSGKRKNDVQNAVDNIKEQINKSNNGRFDKDRNRAFKSRSDDKREFPAENCSTRDNVGLSDDYFGSTGDNGDTTGENGGASGSNANDDDLIDWETLKNKWLEIAKQRWEKCPPITKNFYQEAPEVANLTKQEVERIRLNNNNITVSRVFKEEGDGTADDIPNPIWKFEQCFAAYPDILDEIYKQKFEKPSPIQSQAWPILLKGEDMIGIAQTGTGKTLAFLLPAMIHTEFQSIPRSERGGPNVLVMAPTRELALQIEKEVNKYQFRGMKAVCVYGGGNRREQIDSVEKGVEIIICTPGRLNDLIQSKVVNLEAVTFLILDEADRMLDMGFEPQIRKTLLDIRPDRQTVMTSATWPAGVRRLAKSYMNNPVQVCVGSLDLAAVHTVKQVIEIVEEDDKYRMVRDFIRYMKPDEKVIIFCSRKIRADDLSSELTIEGFWTACIHGNKEQFEREQAIDDITTGAVKILIATDVASRGLDIEDVTHVINYDFPLNIEEYVHRVGRTGRAGRTGISISYLTKSDWAMAADLIPILEEANQEVPNELRSMAQRFLKAKERRLAEKPKYGGRSGGGGNYGGRRNRY